MNMIIKIIRNIITMSLYMLLFNFALYIGIPIETVVLIGVCMILVSLHEVRSKQ